jgi:hypothetical protein
MDTMSALMLVTRHAALVFVLAMFSACGADSRQGVGNVSDDSSTRARAQLPNDPDVQRAAAAVEKFILESKGWRKDQFWVEFKYREGPTLVFWAVHEDDTKSLSTGGKSATVFVDPATNKVVKELASQ